jgi:hypothetical protein
LFGRRGPDKASLATDALLAAGEAGRTSASDNPLADLTAELAEFQRGVSLPGRLSLVGTMVQDATDPDARARYQARAIVPRRARIRAILERAQQLALIDAAVRAPCRALRSQLAIGRFRTRSRISPLGTSGPSHNLITNSRGASPRSPASGLRSPGAAAV